MPFIMNDKNFQNLLDALDSLAGVLIDDENSKEDLKEVGKIYTDLGLLVRLKRAERACKNKENHE